MNFRFDSARRTVLLIAAQTLLAWVVARPAAARSGGVVRGLPPRGGGAQDHDFAGLDDGQRR